ncbi:hypothetical protein SAMN05444401_4012 [Clostridium amylolyticum]|uniref:Uncharacterized protein n=1 Tax=Clostridium amylolyticum TaxID=1121298 RepID=A0A1M6MHP1_9CLOT|nr:hypothetical protein SAMN05444401_4012 [Clostridium amylolyticum]
MAKKNQPSSWESKRREKTKKNEVKPVPEISNKNR